MNESDAEKIKRLRRVDREWIDDDVDPMQDYLIAQEHQMIYNAAERNQCFQDS
jgi:hypothetical protein